MQPFLIELWHTGVAAEAFSTTCAEIVGGGGAILFLFSSHDHNIKMSLFLAEARICHKD